MEDRFPFEAGARAAALGPGPDLGPTEIDPSSSIGEVAFALLRRHLGEFLAREPGARRGEDIEELHRMRVASRRLRAALSLFEEVLPPQARQLRAELKWIAGALGQVRDLDVQTRELESWSQKRDDAERRALDRLREHLVSVRSAARGEMLRALDTKRYERLSRRLADMVRRPPAPPSDAFKVPAVAIAPDLIGPRYRRVRKLARRIEADASADEYHRLRIRCKRLRYALEFFSDVYGKRTRPAIKRLVALQDILGEYQDARVGVERLHDLAATEGKELGPETVFAMGQMAQRYRRDQRRQRARAPKAYERFRGKPWKTVQRLMERRSAPNVA